MLKIILILVYLYGSPGQAPELRVEQKAFDKPEHCEVAGGKRMSELDLDPKFVSGLFAACIAAKVTEARL
jgi:hypothetical protein